ncbi:uncharacterized protein DFL_003050 [Arthrobotrys flagrans]|uniref:Uncharacterized protein n=1 Tax=Arthrobotrys flagrans TaxID=97331 RepID=A0A437ACE7_ARTFL|nr:hypothetical protein DFL_003050 [Arthrobotrys flagrans]
MIIRPMRAIEKSKTFHLLNLSAGHHCHHRQKTSATSKKSTSSNLLHRFPACCLCRSVLANGAIKPNGEYINSLAAISLERACSLHLIHTRLSSVRFCSAAVVVDVLATPVDCFSAGRVPCLVPLHSFVLECVIRADTTAGGPRHWGTTTGPVLEKVSRNSSKTGRIYNFFIDCNIPYTSILRKPKETFEVEIPALLSASYPLGLAFRV